VTALHSNLHSNYVAKHFKVVNQVGDWTCSVWITDAADQPVKGITVTLDPDWKK